jgi:periplasmic divalent cation tolerance protein
MFERAVIIMKATRLLYVTCKNPHEARLIATDLVERKLAACGNIIAGIQSIYRWEGLLQNDQETVLILKTSVNRAADCQARIKAIHSYTTPCILEIDICGGNSDYLRWVVDQTLPP